jgi:hypothetical protein
MIDTDKYEGHNICVECKSDEIPVSATESGEVGLTDYFFSCSQCDFSWYVAVRTDEHEDGGSAGIDFAGWLGEDGNLTWERGEQE